MNMQEVINVVSVDKERRDYSKGKLYVIFVAGIIASRKEICLSTIQGKIMQKVKYNRSEESLCTLYSYLTVQ